MTAASFSFDNGEVDSSPTQISRRRAHKREISRVRHLAVGLVVALAFTSGLGAALAVQVATNAEATGLADRSPRSVAVRSSALRVIDGADDKRAVASAEADKPARAARRPARGKRATPPTASTVAPAAPAQEETASEVILPGDLLDRGIVNPASP